MICITRHSWPDLPGTHVWSITAPWLDQEILFFTYQSAADWLFARNLPAQWQTLTHTC